MVASAVAVRRVFGQQNQQFLHRNTIVGRLSIMPLNAGWRGPGRKPTIILVNDDPFQALVYTATLEGRFHEVRRAADASEALCLVEDRAVTKRLDLVISAHHRPGMSGPDFVAELHRRLPWVPVLVLGAEEELVEDYPASGGLVVFLRKPVTPKRLVQTVHDILARGFCNVA